jgi:hypothetical protein
MLRLMEVCILHFTHLLWKSIDTQENVESKLYIEDLKMCFQPDHVPTFDVVNANLSSKRELANSDNKAGYGGYLSSECFSPSSVGAKNGEHTGAAFSVATNLLGVCIRAQVRPIPWPSFIMSVGSSVRWNVSWTWKPPWSLQLRQSISSILATFRVQCVMRYQ